MSIKLINKNFKSRLLMGSGKFASNDLMAASIQSAEVEIVTVALARMNLSEISEADQDDSESISSVLNKLGITILPNTAGATTVEEAVRLARLAHSAGLPKWIKLEVHPDRKYLLPDPIETLKATEILVKEGFQVLPYIHADPALARRLEDAGASTVMPLGSPIGSNRGIKTKEFIRIIIEQSNIPVIIDAGLGTPSDASEAMEMGADAVLINTSISVAQNPVTMAEAFKLGVRAGRLAYESGIAPQKFISDPSSPTEQIFESKC